MKSLKTFISQAIELPANVDMAFDKTYQRGEKLECRLTLKLQESAIEVEQISVALNAEETVAIDTDAGRMPSHSSKGGSVTVQIGKSVTRTENTFNEEIVVSNAVNLEPNKEYSWMATFTVPKKYNPTYRGVHAHHVWWLSATITLAHRTLIGKKNFSYEWNELIVL